MFTTSGEHCKVYCWEYLLFAKGLELELSNRGSGRTPSHVGAFTGCDVFGNTLESPDFISSSVNKCAEKGNSTIKR